MSWERLQSVLRQVQNRRVRDFFKDLDESPIATTGRAALRDACLLEDSDTAPMALIRLALYYLVLEGGQALHPPLYTMPTDRYQQHVRFAPQVTLYFKEDLADVDDGFAPLDAAISFRLMGETETSITEAKSRNLATKIRNEFAVNSGYRWRKGRNLLIYKDVQKGYSFQVYAASEAEGREVIRKVMSLQGDTLDSSLLKLSQLAESPPIVPPNHFVYGKTRRKPRTRPVGYVRFTYAEMHVWGIPEAVVLVDRSGRRRKAIIAA